MGEPDEPCDDQDEILVQLEVRGDPGGDEAGDRCSCPGAIPCGSCPRVVSALGLVTNNPGWYRISLNRLASLAYLCCVPDSCT